MTDEHMTDWEPRRDELFMREGGIARYFHPPHAGKTPRIVSDDKGRPVFTTTYTCGRCGGSGDYPSSMYEGKCLRCHGKGYVSKTVRLYTQAELDKMNATRDKRRAKKNAELVAAAEQRAAEVAGRRDAFNAERGAWIANARTVAGHIEFVADILAKAENNAAISDAQVAAVDKAIAREEEKRRYEEQSRHLGEVGDKVTVEGRIIVSRSGAGQFGDWYFYVIKDARGMVVFKGSTPLGRDDDVVRFVATVKACEHRDGKPQTVVSRPRKWELVEEGTYRRADREEKEMRQAARAADEAYRQACDERRPMCRISDRSEWPKPAA